MTGAPAGAGADVVVVGAGNAALCAALAAAESGARVLVLEKASHAERGGNSRFTGGLLRFSFPDARAVFDLLDEAFDADRLDVPPYPVEQYVADVARLSRGRCDADLIGALATGSMDAVRWLAGHGVRYELYEKYVEHAGRISWPDRAMVKVRGGGEGLVGALFAAAEREPSVELRYDAQVVGIESTSDARVRLAVRTPTGLSTVEATAVVLASGGFEANPAARAAHLGQSWDLAKARGTRHNTGEVLARTLALGAAPVGHWSGAHAVPVDAGSADVGDLRVGALTTRLSYPYGIMVNVDGHRFVDEGSDFKLLTYAKIGREVLGQPQGLAYQIFDQRVVDLIEPRYQLGTPAVVAPTVEELADGLGVPRAALVATVAGYNAAVREAAFNPSVLDGVGTDGLVPPKSNWAQRLDRPPYVAYPVTCGITFTYGGLGVDTRARVLTSAGHPIPGLYATGEITGGFFYHNYPAGAGLMRGTVFGRVAGAEAAHRARGLTVGAPR